MRTWQSQTMFIVLQNFRFLTKIHFKILNPLLWRTGSHARSYVAAHYIRNLTNSHCLPWLLRQQKTKISWKIAKLWPCVNYTYLGTYLKLEQHTIALWWLSKLNISHSLLVTWVAISSLESWKAISKLGTLLVFLILEFDFHFPILQWKSSLKCNMPNVYLL